MGGLSGGRASGPGGPAGRLIRRARSAGGRVRQALKSGGAKAGSRPVSSHEPAYPLGPRFAGPRQGLTMGSAPSTPTGPRSGGSPRAVARLPPRRGNSGSDAACDRHHVPQPSGMARPHRAGSGGGVTAAPPRAHRGRVRERRPAARDAGGSRGLQSPLARPSVLNTAWVSTAIESCTGLGVNP